MHGRLLTRVAARALCALCALAPALGLAQGFTLTGANLHQRTSAVLAVMGLTLTPDVTTGSLSISDDATGNPDFRQTSLGGGFTISKRYPVYLEGTAAYGRYDPTFVATDGQVERPIPVKWNSVTATGGIGWDFPLKREWTLRPIFNFSLGNVASDGAIAGNFLESQSGAEFEFLRNGQFNAFGLGGSLMLDYERYRPENEIDVELRYTNIYLQSYDTAEAVTGNASAQTLSLWSRWRAPTGIGLLERPLRYVLEYAYTKFLGDLEGALGYDQLHSFGVGLELDSSKYDIIVTRTRLVVRYKIGDSVEGWAVGLAISF